jgi:hypothetical protein
MSLNRMIVFLLVFVFNSLCAQQNVMYNNWRKEILSTQDTLRYSSFTIIRGSNNFGSSDTIHSVDVFKNGECVFGTDLGARQRYNCHMGLSPILNNGKEQLIIEIYWDGMECYYYWLLNLSDSIEVLYDSHRFPDCELGDIAAFADIDHDGVLEFIQRVDADIFAIFKYSKADNAFVFSNPKFSKFVDSYISGRINDLQVFLKSNNQQQDVDYHDELVSQITTIVIQYALSNQEQKGWAFFDKWYRQSDKQTIRNNIQQELANSELFKELHAH